MKRKLTYVNLQPEHAEPLARLQRLCFPHTNPDKLFCAEDLRHLAATIPDLHFVALDGEKVVGLGAGIFIDFDFTQPQHDLDTLIGGGRCENHDPDGDWYYGTDISVHPAYRRRGIGRRLYQLRKEVVRRFNKKGIIAGGVLPGYARHRHRMSAMDYVKRVVAGKLYDPTLSFQIKNGFRVRGVLKDYFDDSQTGGWASLIVWRNPHYVERTTA